MTTYEKLRIESARLYCRMSIANGMKWDYDYQKQRREELQQEIFDNLGVIDDDWK